MVGEFLFGFVLFCSLLRFLTTKDEENTGRFHDFLPSISTVDHVDDCLFSGVEVDLQQSTHLVVEIHTVDQSTIFEIFLVDFTEESTREEIIVRSDEIASQARELVLHESLDASIFDDVQVVEGGCFGAVTSRIDLGDRFLKLIRREEGMTDFMTDQHVVEAPVHLLPRGEGQGTGFDVEHGGIDGLVTDGDVLGGKQLRQKGLGLKVHGICGDLAHDPHYTRRRLSCQVFG